MLKPTKFVGMQTNAQYFRFKFLGTQSSAVTSALVGLTVRQQTSKTGGMQNSSHSPFVCKQ
jgi:hypothetical protein